MNSRRKQNKHYSMHHSIWMLVLLTAALILILLSACTLMKGTETDQDVSESGTDVSDGEGQSAESPGTNIDDGLETVDEMEQELNSSEIEETKQYLDELEW